jgi:hypothetical protein
MEVSSEEVDATTNEKAPTASPSGLAVHRRAMNGNEIKSRQRPTLPPGYPGSTIGAGGLNGRVRNGNGCDPSAMVTGMKLSKKTEDPKQERRIATRFSNTINVMVKPHDRLVPVSLEAFTSYTPGLSTS